MKRCVSDEKTERFFHKIKTKDHKMFLDITLQTILHQKIKCENKLKSLHATFDI